MRTAQGLALLFAVGLTLRLIDLAPRAASRERQVRELPDIGAVERAASRRLALPAYFPRSVPWPPARVLVVGAGPDAVALHLGGEDGGAPQLVLAGSVRAPLPFPAAFFPPALELETRELEWQGRQARLSRLHGEDGAAWVELAWEQDGQAFAYRTRGSLEQLLDLAAHVHREGP